MPLISEKTAELNITAEIHYYSILNGYKVWTYGPTQRRESIYGFDTQLKQFAYPIYLQYKAPESFNKKKNHYKFLIDNKAKKRFIKIGKKTKYIGSFGQVDLLQRWAVGRGDVGFALPCFQNYGVIKNRDNWMDWTCFLDAKKLKRLSSGKHTATITPILGSTNIPIAFNVIVNSEVQEFQKVPTLRSCIAKILAEDYFEVNQGKDPSGFSENPEFEIFNKEILKEDLKHVKLDLHMNLFGKTK